MTKPWQSITIGELGAVITGTTPPTKKPELFGDLYPFLTPSDMAYDSIRVASERRLSKEGADRYRNRVLPRHAVAFVCIGATIGKVTMTEASTLTNQQVNSVVVDADHHDPYFLYYLLRHEGPSIASQAGGAATPIINKTSFSGIPVHVPPLLTQRKIAAVLAAYDELIENNLRRIETLEKMAQAVYREWFVEFRFPGHQDVAMVESEVGPIPDGWAVTSVGEAAENFDRLRKPLSKMQRAEMPGEYPYYGAAKVFDYVDDFIFDGEYLLVAEDGSVVTPNGFPVLQMAIGKFWANNHTHILQGRAVSTRYLYLALSRLPITGYITGAAQPKITQGALNRISILVPSASVGTLFEIHLRPAFELRYNLLAQNANLRATRDLLLPKLVSGAIDVSDLDIDTSWLVA